MKTREYLKSNRILKHNYCCLSQTHVFNTFFERLPSSRQRVEQTLERQIVNWQLYIPSYEGFGYVF